MMTHEKIGQYWCEGDPIATHYLIIKRTVKTRVRLGSGYVKKIFKLSGWKSGFGILSDVTNS